MVSEGVGGLAGELLGDPMIERIVLWQTFGQLLSAGLGPYFRALDYGVNTRTPNTALSPADLATAVVRTFLALPDAQKEAEKAGIDAERFRTLVEISGLAPAPEALAEALRRGLIPEDAGDAEGVGYRQGIAQGNLANKWADLLKELATRIPEPTLALAALLRGQIDDAEAHDLYKKFGGDERYFDVAFHTEGEGPTPIEAGVLARRGIIDWDGRGPDVTSYEQAFYESRYRNKWKFPMRELSVYIPPPRTITAMLREGALTDEQALRLFIHNGLDPELAAAYMHAAHTTKTQHHHDLARGTVTTLYKDRLIDRQHAVDFLTTLGYSQEDADFMLAIEDVALQQHTLSAAIARVRSLYAAHKISRATAVDSLGRLGVDGERQADVMALWDLERAVSVKELTAAEVETAAKEKIIPADEALSILVQMGYAPHDAWIKLALKIGKDAGPEPARDTVTVAPGVQT